MKRPMLLVWLAAASLMTALSGFAQELELGTALDNAHAKAVVSLAFSPDGEVLASGSGDMTIKLWNVVHHRISLPLAATPARSHRLRLVRMA